MGKLRNFRKLPRGLNPGICLHTCTVKTKAFFHIDPPTSQSGVITLNSWYEKIWRWFYGGCQRLTHWNVKNSNLIMFFQASKCCPFLLFSLKRFLFDICCSMNHLSSWPPPQTIELYPLAFLQQSGFFKDYWNALQQKGRSFIFKKMVLRCVAIWQL